MWVHDLDAVITTVFGFEIRYYGLIYVIGFTVAYFLIRNLAKERNLGLTDNDVEDYILYLAFGAIIGARLFYALVYNFMYFLNSPLKIFAVWEGGMAFHGGLIGAAIGGYLFLRKKNIPFYELADITVIPLAFGLFLGRLGNFINGELYGRVTDVPWAMKFPGAKGWRHPSQLYESAKNLFNFTLLYNIRNMKLPPGFMFWLFVFLYGLLRGLIEFFREPEIIFMSLTIGQWFSMVMVIVSSYFLWGVYYGSKTKD